MNELERFREVVARLRDPEKGCPWDRAQTHMTLRRFLVEESGEYLDAVENGDSSAMCDELGDLLLQVFLNAQVAEDAGMFTLDDVAASESAKMIRRHPHVFGEEDIRDEKALRARWDEIKREEKGAGGQQSPVDGITRSLPGLARCQKVVHRAIRAGFAWENAAGAIGKVREELSEVEEALASGDASSLSEELGDLLFASVVLCEQQGVQGEEALHGAIAKFIRRFHCMEGKVDLRSASMEEKIAAWKQAKIEAEQTTVSGGN